jgi:succinoglycan biosynthesis protein ExoA
VWTCLRHLRGAECRRRKGDAAQPPYSRADTDGSREPLSEDLTTIVIPARNEEQFIGECLESVLSQDEHRLEVIVVDGSSDDRTQEIVARYAQRDARVRLLHNDQASIPRSLNLALAAARGQWFMRVDAHSTIASNYVRRARQHLQTSRWGGVGGRKDAVGSTLAGRAIAAAMASRFGVGNSIYHHGTSMRTVDHVPFGAYPTRVARELGGWDERVAANEDFEFDFRLRRSGRQLLFDPRLVIGWRCSQSIPDLWHQYRRYGKGKSTVALLHPGSMRPRHFLPPAFVGFWAVALMLNRRRQQILVAGAVPYAALLCAASVATAGKVPDAGAKARIPAAFLAMHFGWGLGFWQGLAANLKSLLAAGGDGKKDPNRLLPDDRYPASTSISGPAEGEGATWESVVLHGLAVAGHSEAASKAAGARRSLRPTVTATEGVRPIDRP